MYVVGSSILGAAKAKKDSRISDLGLLETKITETNV